MDVQVLTGLVVRQAVGRIPLGFELDATGFAEPLLVGGPCAGGLEDNAPGIGIDLQMDASITSALTAELAAGAPVTVVGFVLLSSSTMLRPDKRPVTEPPMEYCP